MADFWGAIRGTDRRNSRNSLTVQELVPSSGWTEDSTCHFLLVDLPGFTMEEVKLQVDKHGQILVSGERQMSENKIIRFEQNFKTPENAKIEEISGRFEDEILYITVPKQDTDQRHEETEDEESTEEDESEDETKGGWIEDERKDGRIEDWRENEEEKFHEAKEHNQWNEGGIFKRAKEKLGKNKGVIVVVIVAFLLGVFVTQKFQANGKE